MELHKNQISIESKLRWKILNEMDTTANFKYSQIASICCHGFTHFVYFILHIKDHTEVVFWIGSAASTFVFWSLIHNNIK